MRRDFFNIQSQIKNSFGIWFLTLLLLFIPFYAKADNNETGSPDTLQTFSKFSKDDLKMLGVITPPKNAYIQEEYKGIKLLATPKRSYTKKQLLLLKYFIDRTPSVLIKGGPSAIINTDVELVSRAQASGPYIYFDSSDFSTDGFFSAGSLEGVFRGFVHELVHIYQFRQALKEADLEKAREKFKQSKSQTLWSSVVMKSNLIESFANVTEWELITYKYVDAKNARLKDFKNAKTSDYGRVSIMEDMAETISFVTIGDLTELSKQRIRWTVDLLGYKSLDEALHNTFPYAKPYKLVLMGSGITRFDRSKKAQYKKQYKIIDIAHFVSDRKGKHYQEIVSLLEQGFHQRGWEKILSKELTLKHHIKKHIFEYRGKWRDLYLEVISYEDATGYLTKPEETIITALSGYRM